MSYCKFVLTCIQDTNTHGFMDNLLVRPLRLKSPEYNQSEIQSFTNEVKRKKSELVNDFY